MADRYWVGGTAAWDGTAGTKWATTSGGAGGASVPTSADAVFFTNLSTGTCTISTGNTGALSINCTGHTGTIAGSAAISVAGSVTLVAGQTFTYAGTLTITATATLTTAGKTITSLNINAPGGTVSLGSALNIGTNLVHTAGTLTTTASNFAITGVAGSFYSYDTGATKALTLNASTVTFADFSLGSSSYHTLNSGTSTINITGAGGSLLSAGGSHTFYNVSFNAATTGTTQIAGGFTYNQLSITAPSAAGVRLVEFVSTQTITTFICSGTSAVIRIRLVSVAPLDTNTTLNATTWTTVSDVDFRRITLTNAKSPTRGGDLGGNTNITFPAAKTVYWNLAGAQSWSATGWATTAGGTPAVNNFPLAQDTATFTNTGSVTGTITADGGFAVGTVDMSTRTTAMTLSISDINVLGNWTNGSGTTLAGTGSLSFLAISGTQTITSAGNAFSSAIIAGQQGATFALADALTTTRIFTCARGLTLNNNTLTVSGFLSGFSVTRTLAFGTGNITVTGAGSPAFSVVSTGATITGTPVVNMTYSGPNPITISTAGLSEANSISFNVSAGSYALTFSSSGTARNLNFTGFSGTLVIGASLSVFGNLTLSSGMTSPTANGIFLSATSGTKTITSNGKAITTSLNVFGAGGTFQLQDALSITGAGSLNLVDGTLDLNGQTATTTSVLTQTGTKNLTFNGGTLVVTESGGSAFNNAAPTGFTTTAGTGTGTIRMTAGTAKTFVGGGSTYNCTLDQGGVGALTITGSNTFSNITASQTATSGCSILFTAGTTSTFTDWNASGTSGRLLTIGSVTAASHTLSKSTGIVSANFLSVSRSTATGGATWYAGANSTNGGNNTGWIFANSPSASGSFLMFFM